MEPSLTAPPPSVEEDDDDWDTDGFVIPSINVGDSQIGKSDVPVVDNTKPSPKIMKEEQIYLGPHGRPQLQGKQQDLKPSGQKQRFRNKLKEADRKYSGYGRENKVETLRELVGGNAGSGTTQKSSARDWLDPQCHESQFERRSR